MQLRPVSSIQEVRKTLRHVVTKAHTICKREFVKVFRGRGTPHSDSPCKPRGGCDCCRCYEQEHTRTHEESLLGRLEHTHYNRNKRAFLAIARDHGLDRSEVAREAFAWFLSCYEAAGKRLLSDIEKQSALGSIKLAHSRVAEALAQYEAKTGRK